MVTKYEDRTVEELKESLRDKGLSTSGTKDELVARLRGGSEPKEAPATPGQTITGITIPEGAATDWRAQTLLKANSSDPAEANPARETLRRIVDSGSAEELKAFASLGFSPATAKLEPIAVDSDESHPGNPIGTEVHSDTTGRMAPADA